MVQAEAKSAREGSSRARADADRFQAQVVAAERSRLEAVTQAQSLRDAGHQRDQVRRRTGAHEHRYRPDSYSRVARCVGGLCARMPPSSINVGQASQELARALAQLANTADALAASEDTARTTADRLRLAEDQVADLTATVKRLQQQLEHAEAIEAELTQVQAQLASAVQDKTRHEEDFAAREAQLRALNKTLKEEVRKLGKSSASNVATAADPAPSSRAGASAITADVNMEYLKHCILKYMEFDDQRTVRGCGVGPLCARTHTRIVIDLPVAAMHARGAADVRPREAFRSRSSRSSASCCDSPRTRCAGRKRTWRSARPSDLHRDTRRPYILFLPPLSLYRKQKVYMTDDELHDAASDVERLVPWIRIDQRKRSAAARQVAAPRRRSRTGERVLGAAVVAETTRR